MRFLVSAVLVWVCYHSAYEQWRERQKDMMGSRVQARNVLHRQTTSMEKLSSVFLQLTLQDLGICIPINPAFQVCTHIDRLYFLDFVSLFFSLCIFVAVFCVFHTLENTFHDESINLSLSKLTSAHID